MVIRNGVRLEELDRHLRRIASTVRLSGTPGEAAAFDYIADTLAGFGFSVERHEAETLIGYPRHSSFEIVAPETKSVVCNGYALTPDTGDAGVEAELVFVGSSLGTSYAGIDTVGKIVVCDGIAIEDAALAAARGGAVGQVFINPDFIHEMCISPVWGTATPETASLLPSVPAVGIARADGNALLALIQAGSVRARLVTRPYKAWTKTPTLTAELPGNESDDFVLFSGHVDSWHYGAMDNGTANATQVEVGRLLAEHRRDLRRGIRLAFWSGHSHGRYSGSTWYADVFWRDLHDRCVCHVNVDSVGAKGATILDATSSMACSYPFAQRVLRETVGVELGYHRKGRSSDQSFWGHGTPALFGALSLRPGTGEDEAVSEIFGGVSLGWWWHTTEDTVDKIDPAFFARDASIYAETLWRLCSDERLSLVPAAEADEIAAALDRYHDAAGGAIDLAGVAAYARQTATVMRDADLSSRPAREANAATTALCRTLIPVNYTERGPYHHDLAVETKAVPGLRDAGDLATLRAGSDQWHWLKAKLIRERNRVEHALSSAERIARSS